MYICFGCPSSLHLPEKMAATNDLHYCLWSTVFTYGIDNSFSGDRYILTFLANSSFNKFLPRYFHSYRKVHKGLCGWLHVSPKILISFCYSRLALRLMLKHCSCNSASFELEKDTFNNSYFRLILKYSSTLRSIHSLISR